MERVSTENFAVDLCEVYISHIYDKESAEQKPYKVTDEHDAWRIEGQLPIDMVGGTFDITISKYDGRIIKLTHSR
jgi:hypothetical protein